MNNELRLSYPAKSGYRGITAADYDRVRRKSLSARFVWWREMSLLRELLGSSRNGETVLDAPSGTGRFIPVLNGLGYNTVGVDISLDMLSLAQKKYDGAKLVCANCETLTCFKDSEFDYVVSIRFMGHLPPNIRVGVLREFSRVSRKGVIVGYPILNAFAWLKRHLGAAKDKLILKRQKAWWPVSQLAMLEETNKADLVVRRERTLIWGFGQIHFLHLVPQIRE